jgi:hypothetical protein
MTPSEFKVIIAAHVVAPATAIMTKNPASDR